MQVKPRKEYVIVNRIGLDYLGTKDGYFMGRRYALERYAKSAGLIPDADRYVATGLSYKQAKQMMKLFKEQ